VDPVRFSQTSSLAQTESVPLKVLAEPGREPKAVITDAPLSCHAGGEGSGEYPDGPDCPTRETRGWEVEAGMPQCCGDIPGRLCLCGRFSRSPGLPAGAHRRGESEAGRYARPPLPHRVLRKEGPEWGFAFYKYSDEKFEVSVLPTGFFAGTPEECFDCAAMVYLTNW